MGALSPPAAEPGPPCSQQPFVWVKMWVVCSLFICVMFELFNLKQNSLFNKQSSLMFAAYVFSLSHGDVECFHGTRLDETSFNTSPGNQPNLPYDPSSISHRYWFITLEGTSVRSSDEVNCVDLAPSSSKMSQNMSQKWPFNLSGCCLPLLRVPHQI